MENRTAREEIYALKLQMLSLIKQFDSILKKMEEKTKQNFGDENGNPYSE